jgi:uncharacterized protein
MTKLRCSMSSGPKLIVNLTRETVACERTEIADRPLRRMRGLLGYRSLSAGDGLLLQPAPSIHTAFMRFPIDVVFLDGSLQVLKVVEQVPPWRVASARRARSVLELAAGEISRRGIEVGDRLAPLAQDAIEQTGSWAAATSSPRGPKSDDWRPSHV